MFINCINSMLTFLIVLQVGNVRLKSREYIPYQHVDRTHRPSFFSDWVLHVDVQTTQATR